MHRRALLCSVAAGCCAVAGCVTADTDGTATERPRHGFYLLNRADAERRIDLRIVRRKTGEAAVDGEYAIPDGRGARFDEAARWNETYEVTVTVRSGPEETFTWETGSCDGGEGAGGTRNGYVSVEPRGHDLTFTTDYCDTAGTDLAVGPAPYFEVEDPKTEADTGSMVGDESTTRLRPR
jgi:hypothetical protein